MRTAVSGGTVHRVLNDDPLKVAARLVAERFPDAAAAFLGGSVLTTRRTATSDLDIVVLLEGRPAPFRETLRARAAASSVTLDEARLDEICRPERYVANLGPLFDRLAALS